MGIKLKRFLNKEDGASMVEYGVALLVVTAIGITAMSTLGDEVAEKVGSACDTLQGDSNGSC